MCNVSIARREVWQNLLGPLRNPVDPPLDRRAAPVGAFERFDRIAMSGLHDIAGEAYADHAAALAFPLAGAHCAAKKIGYAALIVGWKIPLSITARSSGWR